jgi:hypothetical protein
MIVALLFASLALAFGAWAVKPSGLALHCCGPRWPAPWWPPPTPATALG